MALLLSGISVVVSPAGDDRCFAASPFLLLILAFPDFPMSGRMMATRCTARSCCLWRALASFLLFAIFNFHPFGILPPGLPVEDVLLLRFSPRVPFFAEFASLSVSGRCGAWFWFGLFLEEGAGASKRPLSDSPRTAGSVFFRYLALPPPVVLRNTHTL